MRNSPNAVSRLGQRRRRWASIDTTLGECLVLAGLPSMNRMASIKRQAMVVGRMILLVIREVSDI